jgi:RNA polymerase sigma-70 factor (ECF subfamily)
VSAAATSKIASRGSAAGNGPKARSASTFEADLIALIPYLRSFSRRLCGRYGIAEDVMQEALAKAWQARARFVPGTNLKAWLFTILRNECSTRLRRIWRETSWDDKRGEALPAPRDEQSWALDLSDFSRALEALPEKQREAILLVAAAGYTYDEAAGVTGAAVGTMKSRSGRGRKRIADFFSGAEDLPSRSLTPAGRGLDFISAQLTDLEAPRSRRRVHAG